MPGNGGAKIDFGWFPYIKIGLEHLGVTVVARDFPDPELARAGYWLPFLENELKVCADTILIGHSSGAVAAMRFAEKHEVFGSVLVSACHTDLGIAEEKASGYFDSPWSWEEISRNQKFIIQFASTDDPFIPISEARYIHEKLKSDYFEFNDQQHFGYPTPKTEFPELIKVLKPYLGK